MRWPPVPRQEHEIDVPEPSPDVLVRRVSERSRHLQPLHPGQAGHLVQAASANHSNRGHLHHLRMIRSTGPASTSNRDTGFIISPSIMYGVGC